MCTVVAILRQLSVHNSLQCVIIKTFMCKKKNELIKQALSESRGIVAVAARMLNMTRQALHNRISRNKELKDHLESERESMLDFAENKLFDNIEKGDSGSIFFYLKCQGKKRGYVERQEIDISDRTIKVIQPDDLKDDE